MSGSPSASEEPPSAGLCVDEKSQIQTLNRTQPALPMWPGLPARMMHDYTRTAPTAYLRRFKRHTQSKARVAHLICDNYGTHKHPRGHALAGRPPELPSALHADQCLLAQSGRTLALITSRAIRRGSFDSVARLERAITQWLTHRNQRARPFRRTRSAADIKRSLANVTAIYETRHY